MTSTPTPTPATFTLFPALPTELRLKIWHLVLSSQPPQLFILSSRRCLTPARRKHRASIISTTAPPPPVLHASAEARRLALSPSVSPPPSSSSPSLSGAPPRAQSSAYARIPTRVVTPPRLATEYPPPGWVLVRFATDVFATRGGPEKLPYRAGGGAHGGVERLRLEARSAVWFCDALLGGSALLGDTLPCLQEVEVVLFEGAGEGPAGVEDPDGGLARVAAAFEGMRAESAERGVEWAVPVVRIVGEDGEVLRVLWERESG